MLLKQFRNKLKLTQSDVAEKLNITTRHYQRIESGEGFLRQKKLNRLEDIFQTPQRVLFSATVDDVPEYLNIFLP
ncbi:helix-turn-helix domain-containing protein [Paraliobacillus ryukyuensis]|uniref:helix-turn-helix domain-containing protein n=1 Tax=Paraliobacillus ryukyuensis TaxID=200904 RepID=UPI0009A5C619|nr:helix-turn-helix transcriptional regulator [Paraliobacillus ryukyuensis]